MSKEATDAGIEVKVQPYDGSRVQLLLRIGAGRGGAQVLAVKLQSGPLRMCRRHKV